MNKPHNNNNNMAIHPLPIFIKLLLALCKLEVVATKPSQADFLTHRYMYEVNTMCLTNTICYSLLYFRFIYIIKIEFFQFLAESIW